MWNKITILWNVYVPGYRVLDVERPLLCAQKIMFVSEMNFSLSKCVLWMLNEFFGKLLDLACYIIIEKQ